MNERIGAPVLRAYRRGHPSPRLLRAGLAAVWGFIAWSAIKSYGPDTGADAAADMFIALGAAIFAVLNVYWIALYKIQCKMYHAAEIVVITAMKAYPVTDEQEKEILEARRG